MKLFINLICFSAGIWIAYEKPEVGESIKVYVDMALAWVQGWAASAGA